CWKDLNAKIQSQYYNRTDLPAKLIEFVWLQKNKTYVMSGLERCFRKIAMNLTMPSSELEGELYEPSIFTRGTERNPPEVQEVMRTKVAIREARYFARFNRRTRNIQVEEANHLARVNCGRALFGEVDVVQNDPSIIALITFTIYVTNQAAAVDEPVFPSPSNSPVPSTIVRRTRTRDPIIV
ncbi:uncharacterized protein EV154DRAFT_489162, partial [Mucor mucedo]|uniref:uncharacterized protein n=1 Tax=Mucor mucedo TaxID=29922 RepID=UPI00221EEF2E